MITEVRLPALEGYGFGYQKFTRRAEDWAMVGVCALVSRAADGTCDDVRIGLTNMSATPLRATAAEDALRGGQLDDGSIAAAAEQAAEGTDPPGDLNATPDYKRHLARVLTRRALEEASASEPRQPRSRPGGSGQRALSRRPGLSTAVYLAATLEQPLLLEGEAGVGKTEVAKALAGVTGARLIRLQCHEGIDLHHALYDWDYPRQLLHLRAGAGGPLYSERFLLRRPLLEALEATSPWCC